VQCASQYEQAQVEAEHARLQSTPSQVSEQSAPSEQGQRQLYPTSSSSGSTHVTSHVSPTQGSHCPGTHSSHPASDPISSANPAAMKAARSSARSARGGQRTRWTKNSNLGQLQASKQPRGDHACLSATHASALARLTVASRHEDRLPPAPPKSRDATIGPRPCGGTAPAPRGRLAPRSRHRLEAIGLILSHTASTADEAFSTGPRAPVLAKAGAKSSRPAPAEPLPRFGQRETRAPPTRAMQACWQARAFGKTPRLKHR